MVASSDPLRETSESATRGALPLSVADHVVKKFDRLPDSPQQDGDASSHRSSVSQLLGWSELGVAALVTDPTRVGASDDPGILLHDHHADPGREVQAERPVSVPAQAVELTHEGVLDRLRRHEFLTVPRKEQEQGSLEPISV